jgi:hypothetical protein
MHAITIRKRGFISRVLTRGGRKRRRRREWELFTKTFAHIIIIIIIIINLTAFMISWKLF